MIDSWLIDFFEQTWPLTFPSENIKLFIAIVMCDVGFLFFFFLIFFGWQKRSLSQSVLLISVFHSDVNHTLIKCDLIKQQTARKNKNEGKKDNKGGKGVAVYKVTLEDSKNIELFFLIPIIPGY